MVRAIKISDSWDDEEVRGLAEKFNRYAFKNSLSTISETLDKLQTIMTKRAGKMRRQSAEVLNLIAEENPLLLDEYNTKKAAYIVAGWDDLVEELDQENQENPLHRSSQSPSEKKSGKQKQDINYSNIFIEPLKKEKKIDPKVHKTADEWLKSAEANTFRPKYVPLFAKKEQTNFEDPEEILKNTQTSVKIGEEGNIASQEQELEMWNPDDFEENSSNDDFSDSEQADFLNLDISKMNLKNIKEVAWRSEFNERKCALGDGEFLNYSGKIYQCECGTLYHEICLKTQAIFVEKCQICEREFKPQKN